MNCWCHTEGPHTVGPAGNRASQRLYPYQQPGKSWSFPGGLLCGWDKHSNFHAKTHRKYNKSTEFQKIWTCGQLKNIIVYKVGNFEGSTVRICDEKSDLTWSPLDHLIRKHRSVMAACQPSLLLLRVTPRPPTDLCRLCFI